MATREQKIQILQALVIITEMTDTKWSEATLDAVVQELAAYDFNQVHKALNRVRREHKGRLTLAAILDFLDDGYPSADEAWALVADGMTSESLTIVIPEIAQLAAGDARTLWVCGDKYGARQAFLRMYERMKAEKQSEPCRWVVEAGTDKEQRDMKIKEATAQGKLDRSRALAYLPDNSTETRELLLTGQALTPEQRRIGQQRTGAMLAMLSNKMAMKDESAA